MLRKEIKKGHISLICQKNTKKGILADALVLPQQRGGGLHFHVMLCGRGLGTTHIHRPLTAYVKDQRKGEVISSSFLSYNICRTPLFGYFVTLCTVCHYIGHDGITETALVLIHENGLAAVVYEIVFQVATEVRGREIYLDTLLWVLLLNELQRRYKVAVGTNEDDGVGGVEHTVGYHADGDVHVGLFFLWS